MYYGTLHAELERIWSEGKVVVFDIDVIGGLNVKHKLKDAAISIFIQPPSIAVLEERLRKRQTDTEEKIQVRLAKAEEEMSHAHEFDYVIVNDDLIKAIAEVEQIVLQLIRK
jgi:guanylate kinase